MWRMIPLAFVLLLGGCAVLMKPASVAPAAPAVAAASPAHAAPPPPRGARTAEAFDTTSAAQRQAAAAPQPVAGERKLGRVVVSLGDPAAPGLWLETPLVDKVGPGRVVLTGSGASARVELRPAAGGGNRLSLAAMRLLGADLAGLPEVEVFSG